VAGDLRGSMSTGSYLALHCFPQRIVTLQGEIVIFQGKLKEAQGLAALYKDAYTREVGAPLHHWGPWSMPTDARCLWSSAFQLFGGRAATGAAAGLDAVRLRGRPLALEAP
jgi:hypothetical protein